MKSKREIGVKERGITMTKIDSSGGGVGKSRIGIGWGIDVVVVVLVVIVQNINVFRKSIDGNMFGTAKEPSQHRRRCRHRC